MFCIGTHFAHNVEDILKSELYFPSFQDLCEEYGIDERYWSLEENQHWNQAGSQHWSQACTWCFIAEITDDTRSQIKGLRNGVSACDRNGQDIPILFYPENGTFDFKTLKKGHTICVMMAQKHHFLDMSIGLRIEDLDTVKVIPCAIDELFALSTFCSKLKNVCWGCDVAVTVNDKRCSACRTAVYCSKECQVKDWKDRHRKWCKVLPEFLKMTKIDYSKYDKDSLYDATGRIW